MVEMRFGHRFDARLTGLAAFTCGPIAMVLVQFDHLGLAILGMMIFGMGHGVLTVSFGYVTNMYFRRDVYGRAKGWITTPRALGTAIGPSLGGMLFAYGTSLFFAIMISVLVLAGMCFAALFLAQTRPEAEYKSQ
jgi:MFS family permease